MAKFMCTHTIPPGAFSADQLRQYSQAAQQDPTVKGYRSFANLAEGKAVCTMEAAGKDAIEAWFKKMGMPLTASRKWSLKATVAAFSRPSKIGRTNLGLLRRSQRRGRGKRVGF